MGSLVVARGLSCPGACQFSSVAQSGPTLCHPMNCTHLIILILGFLSLDRLKCGENFCVICKVCTNNLIENTWSGILLCYESVEATVREFSIIDWMVYLFITQE